MNHIIFHHDAYHCHEKTECANENRFKSGLAMGDEIEVGAKTDVSPYKLSLNCRCLTRTVHAAITIYNDFRT